MARADQFCGYFNYLIDIIDGDKYMDLCRLMFDMQFRWDYTIALDSDRAEHGKLLRACFIKDYGHFTGIEGEPCSILEMLVALCKHMSEAISEPGDRHPEYWFERIVDNLGLCGPFDRQKASDAIGRWLARDYDHNGNGGIFPLKYSPYDQRRVDIWSQASAYLCENV